MKPTAIVLVLLALHRPTALAGGSENALVVVNADSWASVYLANEYVHSRLIPASHVVHLSGLSGFERMSIEDFRTTILSPVLQAIRDRRLSGQIDYVLYSADFPTAIDVAGDVGPRKLPMVLTRQAAINGLTFLWQSVLAKETGYLDLRANRYARRVMGASRDGPWTDADQRLYDEAIGKLQELATQRRLRRQKAASPARDKSPLPACSMPVEVERAATKTLEEIRHALTVLRQRHPHSADLLYNLACVSACRQQADEAMQALRDAVDAGWWDYGHALRDHDLRPLRERAEFKQLVARMKDAKFEVQPAIGFRGSAIWLPDGRLGSSGQGTSYLLCTMLAYTSGRGNSVREALAGLHRSIAADGSRPSGTVYFLENQDIRSTTRQWGFRRAAENLRQSGVQAAVAPGILPQRKRDVAGLTAGIANFQWPSCASTILPGAICEHLTSCGGMLHQGDGQTPLTEFLRYGAAGASGTVTEPYAIQAKFPTPFVHWFYAQGCTLAEAFYQSVAGPYQLLIVGDALCRPWARPMELQVDGLSAGDTLRGTVRITPRAKRSDGLQPAEYELYLDGRRILAAKAGVNLELDTRQAANGPHELRIVGRANDAVGTRGMARIPVVIRNGPAELHVSPSVPAELSWDRPLEVNARLAGAAEIELRQHGRPVARVHGGEGRVKIDPRQLGQGPSRIQAVGKLASGAEVWGPPLDVKVVPPAPLPAVDLPAAQRLVPGFQLSLSGGTPKIVPRVEGDWLARAGVGKQSSFVVEAWFSVPDDDVFQFQLLGDVRTLAIDGVPQDWPRGRVWWFVPVSLARGLHRLRLEGIGGPRPFLDARFGGRGALRLDGAAFQHLEPSRPDK